MPAPPANLYLAIQMCVPLRGCGQDGPPGERAHRLVQVECSRGRGTVWTAQPAGPELIVWEKIMRCGAATLAYHA